LLFAYLKKHWFELNTGTEKLTDISPSSNHRNFPFSRKPNDKECENVRVIEGTLKCTYYPKKRPTTRQSRQRPTIRRLVKRQTHTNKVICEDAQICSVKQFFKMAEFTNTALLDSIKLTISSEDEWIPADILGNIELSLPTLPLLPMLTSLELENIRGLNDAITFPHLSTSGLERLRLFSGEHSDASISRILDWILLSSAKTLKCLDVHDVKITKVPSQIPSFTALDHLDLYGNSITDIKNGALSFSVPVSRLILSNNNISGIESGAFQGKFVCTYVSIYFINYFVLFTQIYAL